MRERFLTAENHLFELARRGELRWPQALQPLYPYAAIAFAFFAPWLGQLVALPFLFLYLVFSSTDVDALAASLTATPLDTTLQLLFTFLPLFVLVWLWLRLSEQRPFWTVGLERTGALRKYLRGLLVGLVLFGLVVGILALFGLVAVEATDPRRYGLAAVGGALLVLVGWVIQGAAEEVLARGFLLPIIGVRWGVLAGIGVSSLLFAFLHFLNPNLSRIAVLNLALFGVFTALYALYEGGLWGVFAIHTIWNWAQGNLFGFEVSGQELNAAIVFNLMEIGPDWITGGAFGPEGGVVVTAVLLLACFAIFLVQRRRRNVPEADDYTIT